MVSLMYLLLLSKNKSTECSLITCISRNLQIHLLTSSLLLRTFIWSNGFPDGKLTWTSYHKPTWKEPTAPDVTLTIIKLTLTLICKTNRGLEVSC